VSLRAFAALTRPEGALVVVLFRRRCGTTVVGVPRRHRAVRCGGHSQLIGGSWAFYATVTFGSVIPQSSPREVGDVRRPRAGGVQLEQPSVVLCNRAVRRRDLHADILQLDVVMSVLAALGATAWLLVSVIRRERRTRFPEPRC
jgi:hypothetical protein